MQNKFKGFLLDLDGVIYQDDRLLPGAAQVVRCLQDKNIPFRFVTNTTTKTREQIAQKLEKLGLSVNTDSIFSALYGVERYLQKEGAKNVFALLPATVRESFPFEFDINKEADFVVVCDMEEEFDFKNLNQAFQHLFNGARLIAAHQNRYWKKEGELRLDIGGFIRLLEYAADIKAHLVGKPSTDFFKMALDDMELNAEDVLMSGDDIESDVSGAQSAGIKAALVKGGKFNEKQLKKSKVNPDFVFTDIGDLFSENLI